LSENPFAGYTILLALVDVQKAGVDGKAKRLKVDVRGKEVLETDRRCPRR
jgi:hypothetical protein